MEHTGPIWKKLEDVPFHDRCKGALEVIAEHFTQRKTLTKAEFQTILDNRAILFHDGFFKPYLADQVAQMHRLNERGS